MNLLHINMDIGYASMKLRNRSWGMAYQWRRSKIILVSTEQREWRIWPYYVESNHRIHWTSGRCNGQDTCL